MKLLRLRVEQWRRFRQPFEIADLDPGLNLIAGPNEAGKSTLVRAIRAAFFERHRSTSVDDLLPWGEASASPCVELDFRLDGQTWRLRKTFLNRRRCELRIDGRTLDGEEAEQCLAERLGFRHAPKGASRPEHWGIPGLLWIEQGGSPDVAPAVGHATEHLRRALDRQVGEVASSRGDRVLERVRVEREALLTGTGRPRGKLAEAIAADEAARMREAELRERQTQYRSQVDELGRLMAGQAADAQARPWAALREQQHQAQAELARIETVRRALEADLAARDRIDETRRLLAEQVAGMDEQAGVLARRQAERDAAVRLAGEAEAAEARWAAQLAQADAACRVATERLAQARDAALHRDLARRRDEHRQRLAALDDGLARAAAEASRLAGWQAQAATAPVTDADIEPMRARQRRLDELRIRQDAAATRLDFALEAGVHLRLDGQLIEGQGERRLSEAARIELPGLGTLRIVPGGTDLADVASELTLLQRAQQADLLRLGAPDLAALEARHVAHRQALADIGHAARLLSQLAPQGLERLRAEREAMAQRCAEAEQQLRLLGAEPALPAIGVDEADAALAQAQRHRDAVAAQAVEARDARAAALTRRASAQHEHDALAALLADPQRQAQRRELQSRLVLAAAEREMRAQRVDEAERELARARPDILAQDVERLRRSAEQAEREQAERATQVSLLQGKLEEAGVQGLDEELARAEQAADAARRRCRELRRRADALELLRVLLEGRRQDLTRRLQAPLRRRIDHYLPLLMPQSRLEVGDDLVPERLERDGPRGPESGPLPALSYGAREQLGVIVRLAYADLLREAGRPTLVILDDALVHSDEARLGQMKRVLFDAAQRHQVLIFTCHPQAWRDLGVAARTIA